MRTDGDTGPKPSGTAFDSGVVVVDVRQQDLLVDEGRWAGLMRRVMAEEQVAAPWEAGLVFVPADEMAAVNAARRGIDRPTDVLALGVDDGCALRARDEPRLVGDVVICAKVAEANAKARNRAVDDEIALLVVHGTLHLLGYDHADDFDAEKMEHREQELLALSSASSSPAGSQ
ncbi:rRNA maturation RNase YbeY [Candidatus Poriferisocius sp.]|uniref:rRNA maturation RNase YbeY n=1 Tax=Candidatus Poriferisocius sp. TaxID=3101276 RepID=UPI003B019F16